MQTSEKIRICELLDNVTNMQSVSNDEIILNNCNLIILSKNISAKNNTLRYNNIDGIFIFCYDDHRMYCLNNSDITNLSPQLLIMLKNIIMCANFNNIRQITDTCIPAFSIIRSFGHQLCFVLGRLFDFENCSDKSVKILTGFNTPHINQLINLYDSAPLNINNINCVYKCKRIIIPRKFYLTPRPLINNYANSLIKLIHNVHNYENRNILIPNTLVLIKYQKNGSSNSLGGKFEISDDNIKHLKCKGFSFVSAESISIYALIILLNKSNSIIVQWGALSFLPMIFNISSSTKITVFKHPNYSHENNFHPCNYTVLNKNIKLTISDFI